MLQPFVVAAAVVDWDLQLLFQGYGAETAFNGEYFWWTWVVRTIAGRIERHFGYCLGGRTM